MSLPPKCNRPQWSCNIPTLVWNKNVPFNQQTSAENPCIHNHKEYMNILYMNANFPIFCSPLPAGEFSILAPYFSVQTVQDTALSGYLVKQYIGLGRVLRIRDPLLFLPLDPGREKIWIRDEHPESYLRKLRKGVKILKFFNADPDPGSGMEKFGSRVWR